MGTAGGHVSADPFGRIRGAALKEIIDTDGCTEEVWIEGIFSIYLSDEIRVWAGV